MFAKFVQILPESPQICRIFEISEKFNLISGTEIGNSEFQFPESGIGIAPNLKCEARYGESLRFFFQQITCPINTAGSRANIRTDVAKIARRLGGKDMRKTARAGTLSPSRSSPSPSSPFSGKLGRGISRQLSRGPTNPSSSPGATRTRVVDFAADIVETGEGTEEHTDLYVSL